MLENNVFRNKGDPECLTEELDVIEIAVEALTAIIDHPQTYKYRTHVRKYASQILDKFGKILDVERNQPELNKVKLEIVVIFEL